MRSPQLGGNEARRRAAEYKGTDVQSLHKSARLAAISTVQLSVPNVHQLSHPEILQVLVGMTWKCGEDVFLS